MQAPYEEPPPDADSGEDTGDEAGWEDEDGESSGGSGSSSSSTDDSRWGLDPSSAGSSRVRIPPRAQRSVALSGCHEPCLLWSTRVHEFGARPYTSSCWFLDRLYFVLGLMQDVCLQAHRAACFSDVMRHAAATEAGLSAAGLLTAGHACASARGRPAAGAPGDRVPRCRCAAPDIHRCSVHDVAQGGLRFSALRHARARKSACHLFSALGAFRIGWPSNTQCKACYRGASYTWPGCTRETVCPAKQL